MSYRNKLMYFSLGCAFVVIAQVLLNVVVPKVTAQGKQAVEFDTVTCRNLQIVDDSGQVRAQLEVKRRDDSLIPTDDVIQVFNSAGVAVYRVSVADGISASGGNIAIYTNDGKITSQISGRYQGGDVAVYSSDGKGIASMSIDLNGSGTVLCSRENKRASMMVMSKGGVDGGLVWVSDKNGAMSASMCADANGGRADFYGNNGETRAAIGVDEHGNGTIHAWGKDGGKLQ